MELVILAEKKEGRYRIRNFYPNENKNHLEVAIGDTVVVPEVSPFPFENFSSINNFVPGWKPAYLKVDADITQEEWDSMHHSGIVYHRFPNRKATILEEFKKPFRYSREMLDYFGDSLGTYYLTTWVIHETTRTNDEYRAMSSILAQAVERAMLSDYDLDISFDRYIIPYMEQLLAYKSVSFGRHGSIDKSKGTLRELSGYLEPEEFSLALSKFNLDDKTYFNAWYNSRYDTKVKQYYLNKKAPLWANLYDTSILDDAFSLLGRAKVLDMLVDTTMDRFYLNSDLHLAVEEEENLGYGYWLSQWEVPLVEPESEDWYDYYRDDYPWDDDEYQWDDDEYRWHYEYEPEEPEDTEPYDERLEWLRSLEDLLEGVATLDEIKARLPMANPKLWEDYANSK